MQWITKLAPFPVVLPLIVAAILAGAQKILPRRLIDWIAVVATSAVLIMCLLLAKQSMAGTVVYWFGRWEPGVGGNPFPLGIAFAIDPAGALMGALVSLLMLAAFLFSWQYFDAIKSLYHALMLVFLAAMCGMCLTGDIFNLFVWFELMSAAGIALCGYHAEEHAPLQGAINFAVMNTLGAFLSLSGVAMLYAFTGSLNLAECGVTLASHHPNSMFLSLALLFICSGFLVKAAVFPFQFWLADAHAVAPTPVCVLFSGVMVELGIYAIVRVYGSVFAPAMHGGEIHLRNVLLVAGACTAVIGAIECFGQRHLKRLLAFSTISHIGLMLMGIALLTPGSVGGIAMYIISHGTVKGALFICAGILLHRFKTVDEIELRGVGRKLPVTAALMILGALGLAGVPPFGTFFGAGRVDEAAKAAGCDWVSYIYIVGGALTAGAVLRVTLRVFFGLGHVDESQSEAPRIPMDRETKGQETNTPATMWVTAVLLMLLAMGTFLWPGSQDLAWTSGYRLLDWHGYAAQVLQGSALVATTAPHEAFPSLMLPIVSLLLAVGLALTALFVPSAGAIQKLIRPLRALQSGVIGDYVVWFVVGIAAYGVALVMR